MSIFFLADVLFSWQLWFFVITAHNSSWTVPGSIPCGVTGIFFRGSYRQNHVPWSRISLWKWVVGISFGVKPTGAFGWRPTTLVVPKVVMIRGLNLPGSPRVTSACRGIPLLYFTLLYIILMYSIEYLDIFWWDRKMSKRKKIKKSHMHAIIVHEILWRVATENAVWVITVKADQILLFSENIMGWK